MNDDKTLKNDMTYFIKPICNNCGQPIDDLSITICDHRFSNGFVIPIRRIQPVSCPKCGVEFDNIIVDNIKKTVIVKGR